MTTNARVPQPRRPDAQVPQETPIDLPTARTRLIAQLTAQRDTAAREEAVLASHRLRPDRRLTRARLQAEDLIGRLDPGVWETLQPLWAADDLAARHAPRAASEWCPRCRLSIAPPADAEVVA